MIYQSKRTSNAFHDDQGSLYLYFKRTQKHKKVTSCFELQMWGIFNLQWNFVMNVATNMHATVYFSGNISTQLEMQS